MGLFKNKELTQNQIDTLNRIIPDKYRKDEWSEADFKGSDSIYNKINNFLNGLKSTVTKDIDELKKMESELELTRIKNIKIFNTEPLNVEQMGMIDIGEIKKFGASTTGDRFANGAIGYVIESAIDDAWAKNNSQENAVNEVKLKLLQKAFHYFPEVTQINKFDVDFREIGSSGNVFVYMSGTACKGENEQMENSIKNKKSQIQDFEKEIDKKKKLIIELQTLKTKIPQSPKEIDKMLG